MELVIAPIAELRSQITHLFEEQVSAALDRGEGAAAEPYMFNCGITGGSTALIFLGALREADVPWSFITLYWGDERAVPPEHPDSNFGLAERLLLAPLGAAAPRAIRMPADQASLAAAAREYSHALPPALDLLVLGIGDDGHVCSLFPGHRALQVEDQRVVGVEDAPKPPPRRLTLTMSYVLDARQIWIIAIGPRKRPVLQSALAGDQTSTPVDLVVRQGKSVTIFTDQSISRSARRR